MKHMRRRAPVKQSKRGDYLIKRCTSCEKWKRIDTHFYLRRDGKTTVSGWCKPCTKQRNRSSYYAGDFRHLPFSLRTNELKAEFHRQKGRCFLTGLKMQQVPGLRAWPVRITGSVRWVVEGIAVHCGEGVTLRKLSRRINKMVAALERKGMMPEAPSTSVTKEERADMKRRAEAALDRIQFDATEYLE